MKESPSSTANWHAEAPEQVFQELASHPERGLTGAAAAEALRKTGPNELPAPGRRGPLMRFLMQMHNMLIYVLLVAGVGKIFLGEWIDAGVILGVVFINSLLGFVQEGKAEKALDSIRSMLSPEATVIRDSKPSLIEARDLVPGDVVQLQSGDKVPADLRLFEVKNLRVEEAALTGESVPVNKQPEAVEADAQLGDRRSMAFSSTLVVSGRARGVVVATGLRTEIGRINEMLSGVRALETPLLRQIATFGKALTAVILVVCAMAFAHGMLFHDREFIEMFKASVGIAVAAIPEGLPAIVTITLALGVQRMARRHAIIRRLPAVETLGSVSRICSDKTGTLTRNEMVVTRAVTASGIHHVSGEGYDPAGEIRGADGEAVSDPVLSPMALVSALCNEAHLDRREGRWVLTGDPTEGAMLPFAAKAGLPLDETRQAHPRVNMIPFESEHRFMASVHRDDAGGRELLLVKGAPDTIFSHCDRQQTGGEGETSPFDQAYWEEMNHDVACGGLRVLALAWKPGSKIGDGAFEPPDLPRDLIFLGLVGIIDPPREEAIEAVRQCHEGGIRVTMITGDHADTAVAVAKMLGIGDGSARVTGAEIDAMDDEALEAKCRRVDVFARTSPEHKLRLVRAMQASGQVLAMTGDGVNDAPALKQADVGVAMGIKGTEVSKEAAEMVLADDNFASITAAVKEGRTVFNNIEKAILFILPTNGGQSLTILAALLFGLTLPVTPPQILWINMVTAITLALAISFEPHERDVMRRPPRQVSRPLLDMFGVWRIVFISLLLLLFTFGTFFYMYNVREYPIELSRTTAINALIIGQIFYLINSRFLLESCLTWRALAGNKWIPLSILGVLLLQVLFTYAPFMQTIFGTAAVPLPYWGWLWLGGVVFFVVVELEKLVLRLASTKPAGRA
jgi:magnesium-transporting ATPase (P-type)